MLHQKYNYYVIMTYTIIYNIVSVDETIEETRLLINNITIINNKTAEPKKDAKNVLKNDFIVL